jgi:DNA-binding transcriptional ArsR family regulator
MNNGSKNSVALEKIFHEPNRLAIMSALCVAKEGATFRELKTECNLTDGNLNRHLKVLQENKAIRIKKAFIENKPRTTVFITKTGLNRFAEYLDALETIMKQAQQALPKKARTQKISSAQSTQSA